MLPEYAEFEYYENRSRELRAVAARVRKNRAYRKARRALVYACLLHALHDSRRAWMDAMAPLKEGIGALPGGSIG